jgi:hypothetical protein
MNSKKPVKKFHSIFLFVEWALITAVLLSPVSHALAQNTSGWSYPQTIPSFDLNNFPPILVADQNGNVHAFSSQYIESPEGGTIRAVVYNKWNLDTGWTPPIDILLSPIQEARVTDAYLDDEGYIHLTFWGGNGIDADIYYTKAPLAELDNARAWLKPFVIGDNAGDPEGAVFAQTARGNLVVLFNGRQYGNGLYVVSSNDRGGSWSIPTPIFITNDKAPNIFNIKVIESRSGWLHLIWNVYDVNGQGRGIYYARSPDGETWDQPIIFAEAEEGLGTQTPTIIEYDEELIALYNLPPKIIMQRSLDNGETWQDQAILFPRHVGVNGSLAPVIDGNNTLHLFFGQRISGSPDIHGMWHSVWENPRWTEPEAIIKGPQVKDTEGPTSFDPFAARTVVIQGRVILTTWRTDPGLADGNGVWYSFTVLDSPEIPVNPADTETNPVVSMTSVPSQDTPSPDGIATEFSVAIQPTVDSQSSSADAQGFDFLLEAGAVLAIILVLGLVIIKFRRG